MPSQQPSQVPGHATAPVYGPALPSLADLDAATAATVAAIASPHTAAADVLRAAEAEQAAFIAFERRPGAAALLKAGL
jgi:hypothetical protein